MYLFVMKLRETAMCYVEADGFCFKRLRIEEAREKNSAVQLLISYQLIL